MTRAAGLAFTVAVIAGGLDVALGAGVHDGIRYGLGVLTGLFLALGWRRRR